MNDQRDDDSIWARPESRSAAAGAAASPVPGTSGYESPLAPTPPAARKKGWDWQTIAAIILFPIPVAIYAFVGAVALGFIDVEIPVNEPCTTDCLYLQDDVRSTFVDVNACNGFGPRLCIVPMGSIPRAELEILSSYYRVRYGLQVEGLPGIDVPSDQLENERRQVSAEQLIFMIRTRYASVDKDPNVTLIGVTTVDMYSPAIERWRYVFSLFNSNTKVGVVSDARMHFVAFGSEKKSPQSELRLRKQMNILVGAMYFRLQRSPDPHDAMYDGILGPGDLDRMPADLPIPSP